MNVPHSLSRTLSRRIRNVTGKESASLVLRKRISLWIKTRGPEGAIDLLKRNGQALREYLFNLPRTELAIERYKRGFPMLFQAFRDCSVEQLLRLSKISTAVNLLVITPTQRDKFLTAVKAVGSNEYPAARRFLSLGWSGVPRFRTPLKVDLLIDDFKWASSVSGPDEAQLLAVSPYAESLAYAVRSGLWEQHPIVKGVFRPALSEELERSVIPHLNSKPSFFEDHAVGIVGAAQEPGGKLRCFASPYAVFHAAQGPLQRALQSYLFGLGQDSQFNQQGIGAAWAYEEMRKGKVIHSVDLTNATDLFPLELQLESMRAISIPEDHVRLFEHVSKGVYLVPSSLQDAGFPEELQWSKGQPLGSKPSFQAFSLTHILLLRGICCYLGLTHYPFRVLGDDVVMSDDNLASCYRSVMSELGVPISEGKSYSSAEYAEFAGCSIWREGIFSPGKWKEVTHLNYLSLVDNLGSLLPGEVSMRYQRAAGRYLSDKIAAASLHEDSPLDVLDFDVPLLRGKSLRPIGQRKAILDSFTRNKVPLGEPWVTRRVQMGVYPDWPGGGFEEFSYSPVIPEWLNKAAPWGQGLSEIFARKALRYVALDQAFFTSILALRVRHAKSPLLWRLESEVHKHFNMLVYTRPRKSDPWRNLLVRYLHNIYKEDHILPEMS